MRALSRRTAILSAIGATIVPAAALVTAPASHGWLAASARQLATSVTITLRTKPLVAAMQELSALLEDAPQHVVEQFARLVDADTGDRLFRIEHVATGRARDGLEIFECRLFPSCDLELALSALRARNWDRALGHLESLLGSDIPRIGRPAEAQQ